MRNASTSVAIVTNYPTAWQRKVLWVAITTTAITATGTIAVLLVVLFGRAMGFLQPVLIPFAVAAVLAFLLDPVVGFITVRTRLSRTSSVMLVFVVAALLLALLFVSVVPRMYQATAQMVRDMPSYTQRAEQRLLGLLDASQKKLDRFGFSAPQSSPAPAPSPAGSGGASLPPPPAMAIRMQARLLPRCPPRLARRCSSSSLPSISRCQRS